MESVSKNSQLPGDQTESPVLQWAVIALVFASFFSYSAIQTTIPGANEPHYLCKAKHYWNPEFCRDDPFLNSSNAHLVFYQTVGVLTRWFTLTQTAWIGRVLGYGLLAVGWTFLVRQLLPGRWSPLWTAWVFLAITRLGDIPRLLGWSQNEWYGKLNRFVLSLSGEWLVGGLESKVFAYGFVMWAMACALQGRAKWAGVLTGLAISFHPVVGIWAVIAAGIAWIISSCWNRFKHQTKWNWRETAKQLILPLQLLLLCSLPGLIPALRLIGGGDPELAQQANEIQVFSRLAHHLDPFRFHAAAWVAYGAMIVLWLVIRNWSAKRPGENWFALFVIASLIIACGGWIVGRIPRLDEAGSPDTESTLFALRMSLMKFYPFRLCDVFIPVALAVAMTGGLICLREKCFLSRVSQTARLRRGLPWGFCLAAFVFSLWSPSLDRDPSRMDDDTSSEWLAACHWIDQETPADSVVYTATSGSWAFKWHAHRAEYYSYKDIPQDAIGILDWKRRAKVLDDWAEFHADEPIYTAASLIELHELTGITHLICEADVGPFEIAPAYVSTNKERSAEFKFHVYRLKDAYQSVPKR